MNIEQNNKLILEFMGYPTATIFHGKLIGEKPSYHDGELWQLIEEISYHSDWSQLMPVVEKIEALKLREPLRLKLTIEQRLCVIQIFNGGFRVNSIISVDNTDKISAVYSAVTQFIEWYTKPNTHANG